MSLFFYPQTQNILYSYLFRSTVRIANRLLSEMLEFRNKLLVPISTIILLVCSMPTRSYAQIDSTYIASFGQRYSIQTYFGSNFTSLTQILDNDQETTYMPNAPYSIGLGLSWGKSSIGFGYGFPFMRDKKKGDTKSNTLAFQYHYYGRNFIADVSYQDYKGLYTETENKDNVHFYPDIHIKQYGVLWQYVFNGKKLSYRAAFNQTERQLKSAGSFLLGGGATYNTLKAETSLNLNEKNYIKNAQLGINAGYGYTWVVSKYVYVSGTLSLGFNLGSEYMGNFNLDKVRIYPSVYPRIAFGYNQDSWSLRLSAINNLTHISFTKAEKLSFMTGNIQISFIKRFGDIPIPALAKYLK